jgi:cephalosporin-C deacetylase-like acetyl esterase
MKKFDDAIKAVEEVKAVAPESQGIRKFEEYWKPEIEKAKAAAKGEEKPAEKIEK